MGLTIVALGAGASAVLAAWGRRRAEPPLEDGARTRTIAELGDGRFRVRGRIVPLETTTSEVDGATCVYVLRASVDPEQGVLRDVAYALEARPFRVEDGTGAIEIDPQHVIIDGRVAQGEAALVVEQRLCAGEEVEIVARFRPCARGAIPYRGEGRLFEPIPDESDPPRVAPSAEKTVAGLVPRGDVMFARAAAAVVLGASALLGWLVG